MACYFRCLSSDWDNLLYLCRFIFKETLQPERRLKLSARQVLSLYKTIFQDKSFRGPMVIGCFTGAVLFCYISSAASVLIDQYHLSQQHFAYAFGFNAVGITLFSSINKRLARNMSIIQRLKLGGILQLMGVLFCLVQDCMTILHLLL